MLQMLQLLNNEKRDERYHPHSYYIRAHWVEQFTPLSVSRICVGRQFLHIRQIRFLTLREFEASKASPKNLVP